MFGRQERAKRQRGLRIFFATDVHGSERCFRKFLAAAQVYEADVLLLGGDVAGKGWFRSSRANGSLSADVHGERVTVPVAEARSAGRRHQSHGFLSRTDGARRGRRARGRPGHRSTTCSARRSWPRSNAGASSRRSAWRLRSGASSRRATTIRSRSMRSCAPPSGWNAPRRELCELGPVLLASLGDVTPTPWNTEREYSEDELGATDRGDDGGRSLTGIRAWSTSTVRRTARALTKPPSSMTRSSR